MTTPLMTVIKEEIKAAGFMRLDRYMHLALGHPQHGYYMSGQSFGVKGDFITAPEISQMFGELMGLWSFDQMQRQDILPQAGFFELGPGRGTLMADATRVITPFMKQVPAADHPPPIHMLEISPALKEQQQKALAPLAITHHAQMENLPPIPLIFIANEFFDALPIRQFIRSPEGWQERVISLEKDQLKQTTIALDDVTLDDIALEVMNQSDAPQGSIYEYAPALPAIVTTISRHINQYGGAALIIDYGKSNAMGDSLQAVRDHKPVDILDTPGAADLSAWVDFSAIKAAAGDATVWGPTNQGDFLKSLGLYQRAEQLSAGANPTTRRMIAAAVDRLSSPAQMGQVFQVMAILPQGQPQSQSQECAGFAS